MRRNQKNVNFLALYRKGRLQMNKWIKEEWSFRVEVTDGYAKDCRLGLEKGDVVFLNMKLRKEFPPCNI